MAMALLEVQYAALLGCFTWAESSLPLWDFVEKWLCKPYDLAGSERPSWALPTMSHTTEAEGRATVMDPPPRASKACVSPVGLLPSFLHQPGIAPQAGAWSVWIHQGLPNSGNCFPQGTRSCVRRKSSVPDLPGIPQRVIQTFPTGMGRPKARGLQLLQSWILFS